MTPLSKQEIARRLVEESEALILRQQELIAALEKGGDATGDTQRLLTKLEHALASLRETLSRL